MGSWLSFYLVASVPLVGLILAHSWLIESPRWLISQRKIEKCVLELKNICDYNGTKFSEEIIETLESNNNSYEVSGIILRTKDNLFASWRIILLFFLMFIGWCANLLITNLIFFNVNNIGGNPHLVYVFIVVAEVPGYLIGKYLADIIGRRFARAILGIFVTLGSVIVIFTTTESELPLKVCFILIKLFNTGVTFVSHFHTIELFPTSIRQTGLAASMACSGFVASFSPRILYLGRIYDKRIPFIVGTSLGILQIVVAILMPETLRRALPETMTDTENLIREQKLWTMPKKRQTGI